MINFRQDIRFILMASITLVAVALPFHIEANPTLFEQASEDWRKKHYRPAYNGLAVVREQPHGRRPAVDYMLGTSGCRLTSLEREYGYRLLDWMLYAYSLSHESRKLVADERKVCQLGAQDRLVGAQPEEIRESRSAGMSGYGKTFYWTHRDQQVSSYPMRRIRPMKRSTFTARLVPLGDESSALSIADSLSDNGRVLVHENFLIIGTRDHSPADLRQVGRTLNRYLRFLINTYGVVEPPYYLRVHLFAHPNDVQKFANEAHGLDVSPATIGYTFVDDATVVGFVPETGVGTILHELFHLMVRSNFGDVPQWLDEGVASLYEVSGRRGDHYFGLDNWRRRVLDEVWHLRPTLDELIRSEWFLYDDPSQIRAFEEKAKYEGYHDGDEGARQAAMMAMARFFAMYLEQRGKLVDIYRAIRDRGFAQLQGDARDHAVALVVKTLDADSIHTLDEEFVEWYRNGFNPISKPSTEGGRLHVATAAVNVRSGPGTSHNRIMTIDAGTQVAVRLQAGKWFEIRMIDGTTAYISARYLEPIESNEKALPKQ